MSDFIFSGNLRCTRDLYIGPNQTVPAFAINELGDVQLGGLRGMRIPKGTTAERPFKDGTENRAGYIRYNTETNKFESYGSYNEWGDVGGVSGGYFQKVDGGDQETRVKVDNSLDRHGGKGISFYTSCRSQLIVDSTGNVGIGIRGLGDTRTTPCCALHVGGTSAVKLPVGNTAQRPYATNTAAHAGFIRYNNQTSQFEGFGAGDSWGSLGGVMDVDQDTFIKAESSANADNDELWFVTNGHRRMTIASDGNISIDSNMQINGNMDVFTISKVVNQVPNDITLNGTVEVGFGADAPDTLDNGLYLWNTGTGTSSVGRIGSNEIALNTGSGTNSGTERVRIDGSGNVGIGTTPQSKLDVSGSIRADKGQTTVSYFGYSAIGSILGDSNSLADFARFSHQNMLGHTEYALMQKSDGKTFLNAPTDQDIFFRINNQDKMILKSDGNFGIGTSNPLQKFHLKDGGIMLENANTYTSSTGIPNITNTILSNEICGINGSGSDWGFLRLSAGGGGSTAGAKSWIDILGWQDKCIRFGTEGQERMRIVANGNVGIGTTSPDSIFHVLGSDPKILLEGTGQTMPHLQFKQSGNQYVYNIEFSRAGTNGDLTFRSYSEKMRLTRDGNLGIGKTPSSSFKLDVSGTGSVTSSSNKTGLLVRSSDVHTVIGSTGGGTNVGLIQVWRQGSAEAVGSNVYGLKIQPSGGEIELGATSNDIKVVGLMKTYSSSWVKPFYPQKYRYTGRLDGSEVTLSVPSAIGGSSQRHNWVPNLVSWMFSSYDVDESNSRQTGIMIRKSGGYWKIWFKQHHGSPTRYCWFTILWIHINFCDTDTYASDVYSDHSTVIQIT